MYNNENYAMHALINVESTAGLFVRDTYSAFK